LHSLVDQALHEKSKVIKTISILIIIPHNSFWFHVYTNITTKNKKYEGKNRKVG